RGSLPSADSGYRVSCSTGTTGCSGTQSDSRLRSSHARARSVTGSARSVTNIRMPRSMGRLGSAGGHQGLGLLEMLQSLLLHAIPEGLVARVVLRLRLAEILPFGFRLLDLREELLLDLGRSLGPA